MLIWNYFRMNKLSFFLIFFCSAFYAFSQGVGPTLINDSKIKLDGSPGDWSGIKPIMTEMGGGRKDGEVDVKTFHMNYTPTKAVFKALISPTIEKHEGGDKSILQLNIDVDNDNTTGISPTTYIKLTSKSYKGYEFRYDLLITKDKKAIARLYSHKDQFKKAVKEYTNLGATKNTIEFEIPYADIGYTASGKNKIKFLFAEMANTDTLKVISLLCLHSTIPRNFQNLKQVQIQAVVEVVVLEFGNFFL